MLTGIVIPLLIGTFIVFGQSAHLYTPIQGYYLLALCMFIVLMFIFRRSKNITTKLPQLKSITLQQPCKHWIRMRFFIFIFGMLSGLTGFLPILMVLLFIGKEDAVGTVQSLSAVVAAVIIYFIGKKINREQRLWIIAASVILLIIASITFAVLYSKLGVYIFFIFQSVATPLGIIGYTTLYYEIIERENEKRENHYAHIFDSEVFINSGRIVSVGIFLLAIHFFSQGPAMRYILVLFTIFQILLLIIAASIEKGQRKKIPVEISQVTIDQV
jgi:YQGE family putative transporter